MFYIITHYYRFFLTIVPLIQLQIYKLFFERPKNGILFCHTPATTSISTNAPFGKVFTATAERAGYGSVKNSA